MKRFLVCMGVLVSLSTASAVTLDEALDMALHDSEAVRITGETARSIRAEGRKALSIALPHTDIEAQYLRTDTDIESPFFVFPDPLKKGGVQAGQMLFAGGRIWNSIRLNSAMQDLAGMSERSGLREIRRNVRLAFYTVLLRKAQLHILEDRVRQREEEVRDAMDLHDAGMATSLDARQAGLNLNNAVDRLKEGEASYQNALILFNQAMGRSGAGELLEPEGRLGRAPGLEEALKALERKFAEGSLLDIGLAEKDIEKTRLRYNLVLGEFLPQLSLVASAERSNETTGEMEDVYAYGLVLKWNILDGGLTSARRSAAHAELRAAEERLEQKKKEIAGTIRDLRIRAASLAQRIALQQESVEMAKANYEDARGHYRAGTITLTRLGEFNLAYAEARFRLQRLYFLEQKLLIEALALLE